LKGIILLATYSSLRRNLKRNLTPYNETKMEMPSFVNRFVAFVLAVILTVSVPVLIIPTAANFIFRIPDLYTFDMNRTANLKEAEISLKPNQIGSFISLFMRGKADDFDLIDKTEESQKHIFSDNDAIAISSLRDFLDRTVPLPIIAIILFAGLFFTLFRMERYRHIRIAYTIGWILTVIGIGFAFFVYFNKSIRNQFWKDYLEIELGKKDGLSIIFGDELFLFGLIACSAIALVMIIIMGSVTFALTKGRERMF